MKANELTPEYIADYLKIDDPEAILRILKYFIPLQSAT